MQVVVVAKFSPSLGVNFWVVVSLAIFFSLGDFGHLMPNFVHSKMALSVLKNEHFFQFESLDHLSVG